MGKRKFKPRSKTVTASFFTDHAHRWPEAGEPMAYAMACVEVVIDCSPLGRDLYQELVKAWSAPGVKAFYEQFMAEVPEDEVEGWKEGLMHPELMLLPDPNKPFLQIAGAGSSLQSVPGSDEIVKALEGEESTAEVSDTAELFGLVFAFIIEGFNRESDLERGVAASQVVA